MHRTPKGTPVGRSPTAVIAAGIIATDSVMIIAGVVVMLWLKVLARVGTRWRRRRRQMMVVGAGQIPSSQHGG